MFVQNRVKISLLIVSLMILVALFAADRAILASPLPSRTSPEVLPTAMVQWDEIPSDRESGPVYSKPASLSHSGSGPFGPPNSLDNEFSVDSGSTMDEYRFRAGSPIQFAIPINRVVGRTDGEGYLLEPEKLIQNGIISSRAQLKLLVWDIDEDYTGDGVVREIDKVYLNGHYIGDLSGANETWSVTRLDFDIRYLKFAMSTCNEYGDPGGVQHLAACHTPPVLAENIIRIDIDTANTGSDVWAVEVDWGALSFEAARPILFVHGKGGSANGGGYDYWDKDDGEYYFNFRGKFSSAGFLTAITENRLGAESSIAYNALQLKTIIGELCTRYGTRKINIVAHSKGGLDSRGYISDSWLNPDGNVDILLTLASPHHGSYLADVANDHPILAGLLGNPQTDAMRDLTESYMNNTFNPSHPARPGVRYYTVAADSGQDYWYGRDIPLWQIHSLPNWGQRVGAPMAWALLRSGGQYKGENDFLVTAGSANLNGIPGHSSSASHLGTYSLNHHSIRAAERQMGVEDDTIANLARDVLDVKGETSGGWLQSGPTEASRFTPSSAYGSGLSVWNGSVQAGQALTRSIGIDSQHSSMFSLLWQDEGDLYFNLVAPDGTVITSGTTLTSVTYLEDRTGGALNVFLSGKACIYTIVNPQPGSWLVQMSAAANVSGGQADWALLVAQESPVTLVLATDQPWHKLNDAVLITATVKNGTVSVPEIAIQATVVVPNGITQTLTLADNGTEGDGQAGDGIYSYRLTATESGIYRLSAHAGGSLDGIAFERMAFTELMVGSTGATLGTGYSDVGNDANSDGLYEELRIHVPLNISVPGQYAIIGTLYDSNQREMGQADSTVSLGPGNQSSGLNFDGRSIAEKGGTGPFTLRDLRLINKGGSTPLQMDFLAEAYTTNFYSNSQFQRDPLALTGTNSDSGEDLNGNGKYDVLTMNLGIHVQEAGEYNWNARLVDSNGYEFGWSSGVAYLEAGNRLISFHFDGRSISENKIDGPYYLKDLAMWGPGGYLSVINAAATSTYDYTQFEPPYCKIYFPLGLKIFGAPASDTYEPNNMLSEAYGPLVSGTVYTSFISINSDDDYYYFDITTLGRVTVDLSHINAPTTDYDLELYNSSGARIGGSWGVTVTEQIVFEPIAVGRYYVRVYLCCRTNSPTVPYYLRTQFNGAIGSGDIYGTVRTYGNVMGGVPLSLDLYNPIGSASQRIWTVTDSAGQYHFWGLDTLQSNQSYYVRYAGNLGSSYIGYWTNSPIMSYTAGAAISGGDMDISPLNLGDPNTTTGISLPVVFNWTPRASSPDETYYLYLFDSNSTAYWFSEDLGHTGVYTLTNLPAGFATGYTYRWFVYAYDPDRGQGDSYYSNNVAFAATNVPTVTSAALPGEWARMELLQEVGRKPLRE